MGRRRADHCAEQMAPLPFRKQEFDHVWIVETDRSGSDRGGHPRRSQHDACLVGRCRLLLWTRLRLHGLWLR